MIEIVLFESQFQKSVDALVSEISNEFDSPISMPNTKIERRKFDKFWVAKFKDEVIGTIAVINLNNKIGILKSMFVKQTFRGREKGVSNLLLQTLMNWCKEEGISNIFLGTMAQFKAAQKFYQKNGFVKIEKSNLPEEFPHFPLDDIFFYRKL